VPGERAPAEADDFAARIGDFEGDAAAEGVDGALAVFALAGDAGGDDLLDAEAFRLELVDGPGPLVGRKADAEPLPLVRRKTPAFQIFTRLGAARGAQRAGEELGRARRCRIKPLAAVALAPALVLVPRQRNAGELGDLLHRLGVAEALKLHRQGEDVAFLAAAEAIEDALLVQDVERGRFFLMEGTAGPIVAGGGTRLALVPGQPLAGIVGNRNPVAHLTEQGVGKTHQILGEARWRILYTDSPKR